MGYVYGIFWTRPDGRQLMTFSARKAEAIAYARKQRGSLGRMPARQFRAGGPYGWDAPTFKVTADFVADYSQTGGQ